MNFDDIKKTKDKVEYILEKYPDSRNDDRYLCVGVWGIFYANLLFLSSENDSKKAVLLSNVLKLPSQENIARIRRKFQEVGRYLPTNKEVALKRKINECVWREYMLTNSYQNMTK